jgi:hypothetical protein
MTLPQVTTQSATSIGATSATLSGSIVSLGDPAYEERGFVYGTVHNPTVEDDTKKLVSGRGLGDFSANITDLTTGTTYYVRAYATNTVSGASYGAEVSITPQVPQYVELPVANIAVQKTDISSGSINYTTANSECGSSTVNGYTDWRLPTLSELSAIYNNKSMFTGFQQASNNYDYYYWTSTSNGSSSHYQINMTTGGQSSGSNSSTGATYLSYYRARCVRSLP